MKAPISCSSRRDFFRACMRYPVILGMAVVGVSLVSRAKNATGCQEFPVCQTCKLLPDCAKPQALETRKAR